MVQLNQVMHTIALLELSEHSTMTSKSLSHRQEGSQLRAYHMATDRFLTTSKHFMGGDNSSTTKTKLAFETFALRADEAKRKKNMNGRDSVDFTRLAPGQSDTRKRVQPSSMYANGQPFIVELPHSFITYRPLKIKVGGSNNVPKSTYQSTFTLPSKALAAQRWR